MPLTLPIYIQGIGLFIVGAVGTIGWWRSFHEIGWFPVCVGIIGAIELAFIMIVKLP